MRLSRRAGLGLLALSGALILAVAIATASVVQVGNLRITVRSQIQPFKLPRETPAPIAVFIAGHLQTPSGEVPPQLQRLTVRVNRHGLLQSRGLPSCQIPEIQPASTQRALAQCGDALVGSGQFWANIVLPGQPPYPTQGRLLLFNGRIKGRPALLAQIYTSSPFSTSFVIPFTIKHVAKGPFGTELTASLPEALGEWGYLDRIKLTLRRKYRSQGEPLSYFNAACPAIEGADRAAFALARATFAFAKGHALSATVTKTCGVKE